MRIETYLMKEQNLRTQMSLLLSKTAKNNNHRKRTYIGGPKQLDELKILAEKENCNSIIITGDLNDENTRWTTKFYK